MSLETLDCYVRDLSPLRGMTTLDELTIRRHSTYTDGIDLSPLAGLMLRTLTICDDTTSNSYDLSPLANCGNLTVVTILSHKHDDISVKLNGCR